MEPLAGHRALRCSPKRICSPATSTRPRRVFAEAIAAGRRAGQHRHDRARRGRARVVGDGSRASGTRRPSTWSVALADDRRASDARLRRRAAGVRRRRSARLAPGRPERRRTVSSPGRCGPGRRARSCCRSSPCGCGCSSPRCTARWATRRPRATCCARSTTSCSTGPLSAPWSTRSRSSASILTVERRAERPGGSPLTPAELRLLPYLQTHLTYRRDRRAAVRVPQHRQHRGQLDLPQARRLLARRRGATGHVDRPARRLTELNGVLDCPPARSRCRSRAPAPGSERRPRCTASRRPDATPRSTSTTRRVSHRRRVPRRSAAQ